MPITSFDTALEMARSFRSPLFTGTRKSLLFLCLSVASLGIAIPNLAFGAQQETIIFNDSSTTSTQYTITGLPTNTVCTYDFGFGTYPALPTGGIGGSCNTNDFLVGDPSVTIDPNFSNPLAIGEYVGYIDTASTSHYVRFDYDGTNLSQNFDNFTEINFNDDLGFNSNYNTRFTGVNVFSGGGNVKLNIGYFLDTNEYTVNNRPDAFNVNTVKKGILTDSNSFSKQKLILPLDDGYATTTITMSGHNYVDNKTYLATITFWNIQTGFFTFLETSITVNFTMSNGVVDTFEIINISNNLVDDQNSRYQPCSLSNLSGCISNSFIFLIFPSANSIEGFVSLSETMAGKFPFAYVADFSNIFSNLYNGQQTVSSELTLPFGDFGTITIISAQMLANIPFAPLIKTSLGYMLWLMFALQMYRRTLRIFDPVPV